MAPSSTQLTNSDTCAKISQDNASMEEKSIAECTMIWLLQYPQSQFFDKIANFDICHATQDLQLLKNDSTLNITKKCKKKKRLIANYRPLCVIHYQDNRMRATQ